MRPDCTESRRAGYGRAALLMGAIAWLGVASAAYPVFARRRDGHQERPGAGGLQVAPALAAVAADRL